MRKAYIINTNRANRPGGEDEFDMIRHQKVAAYFSPWKNYIEDIQPGDLVFLYSNSRGIIARGIATGVAELADYNNEDGYHPDEQVYMHLDRFEELAAPMEAAAIIEAAGQTIIFNRTSIPMDYKLGLKIWRAATRKHCAPPVEI